MDQKDAIVLVKFPPSVDSLVHFSSRFDGRYLKFPDGLSSLFRAMLNCSDFSSGSDAMPVRHYWNACLCAAWVLVFSACSTGPDIDDTIHESPQGLVYLTRISDRSFQAAHPIKIDPTTIGRVLSGVLVREDQSAVQNFFTGAPDARRAFSEGEVAYLAPLISEGLRRAASDQQGGISHRSNRTAPPCA